MTGPPTRDPGILASRDVADLWRQDDELPWWEASDDVALALVCLDELDRRGLEGVAAEWEGHPLLATARWNLAGPVRNGLDRLAEESAAPGRGTGCSTVRLVLAMVAASPDPPTSPDSPLEVPLVVTAVQRLRERDALLLLIPTLAGASRHLLQRAAIGDVAPGENDAPREAVGRVLRAVGVADRTGAHLSTLPGAALWRMAVLRHLVAHRSTRAVALGWLVAADALAAAGRAVTGERLRESGFDVDTARAWDSCVIGELATLEAAEHLVDTEPSLAPALILGARACLASAASVERALEESGRPRARAERAESDDPGSHDPAASTDLNPTEGLS